MCKCAIQCTLYKASSENCIVTYRVLKYYMEEQRLEYSMYIKCEHEYKHHVHVWKYVCVCVYAYKCVCIFVCVCVQMYVCTHTYINKGIRVFENESRT